MNKVVLYFFSLILFTKTGASQMSNSQVGQIIRHEAFSSAFIASRNVDVWLPENYSSDTKYAVLYMHDGQMLFDSTSTWNKQEWGIDEVAAQLINSEKVIPFIIVGIWNNGEYRHADYFPEKPINYLPQNIQDSLITTELQNKPLADVYLKFLVDELKPFIDSAYSVYTDRAHTFIGGSSMGGLISIYGICEYPKIFGGAACLSTHWPGSVHFGNDVIPNAFIKYLEAYLPSPADHKIYFDFGTATLDQLYEPYQIQVDALMRKKGFTDKNWVTKKFEGEPHTEEAWRKRIHIPLTFLLGK